MRKQQLILLMLCSSLLSFGQKVLWGVNRSGGDDGNGSIYYYNPANNEYVNQEPFVVPERSNGIRYAEGSMIYASNNKFYGITSYGGSNNLGVIFEYDPVLDTLKNIHSFNRDNGDGESESMVEVSGKLYGVTYDGGTDWDSRGVLFEYDLASSSYSILHEFIDIRYPRDGVVAVGRKIYGITEQGGAADAGVLFEYDIDRKSFEVKYEFKGSAYGEFPRGNMVMGNDGYLYGTTMDGGAYGYGIMYKYYPGGTSISIIKNFTSTDGGGIKYLTVDGAVIYGVANNDGADSHGTIFKYTISTRIFTVLHQFESDTPSDTFHQGGGLVKASNGKFYGTTSSDGDNEKGYIYEWDPATNTFSPRYHNTVEDGYYPGYDILVEANAPPTITSVATSISEDQFKIYPNPSTGDVFVFSSMEWTKLELINSQGILVETVTTFDTSLNFTIEKSGVYIMKIYTKESIESKKVVIK